MHASIAANTTGTLDMLERTALRAGLTEPAMEEIIDYIQEAEKRLFETQGASSGRTWAPRSETTEMPRGARGDQVMVQTGALEDSLTMRYDKNAIRIVGPGWLQFGTKLSYGEIHMKQHYARGGKKLVVARRPIDLNRMDRYYIGKIFLRYLMGRSRLSPGISVRNRGGGIPG